MGILNAFPCVLHAIVIVVEQADNWVLTLIIICCAVRLVHSAMCIVVMVEYFVRALPYLNN